MRELAQGLYQLRGFPPNMMNVYVADDVLIDTATRHASRRILRQLESKELSLVALTHCHADHAGSAHAVCEARGIPLALHNAEVDFMEGRRPIAQNMPQHPLNRMLVRLQAGQPHPVERRLREGDEVGGFRVVHAPGHSPGLVMFFRDFDRVAVVGDVVFGIHPATGLPGLHESPAIWTLDRGQARRSVTKLVQLDPALVCFGHGPPLRDIEKLRRLADRLEG